MAEIVPATDDDFARFYGGQQVTGKWVARAMRRGRLIAGFGGLIELDGGEWLAFFEVPAAERKPSLLRHIKAAFAEAREQGAKVIKATCDTRIPRAESLMRHLGFEPTEEQHEGREVWVCQVSN